MKEQFFESLHFEVKIKIEDCNGEEFNFELLPKDEKEIILDEIKNGILYGEYVREIE